MTHAAQSEGDGRRRGTQNATSNDYMKARSQRVRLPPDPIEVGFHGKDHMNISVSRQELDETAELLDLLRVWERFTKIAHPYKKGEVTFKMGDGKEALTHGRSVDEHWIDNHPSKTCVEKCHRDLNALFAGMAKEAAIKAVEIIKSHMPIPVE